MKTIAQRMGTIGLQILAAWAASGGFLCALAQASPKGPVVLTVSGKINAPVSSQVVTFDMVMLQAMPQKTWTTRTPWDVHQVTFSGPLLRDVLAAVKASGSELRAVALNDYRVRIPVSDAEQFDVVVALRMNGKPIPVRTKGPLFIVYPFDTNPVLQAKLYYERAIWQLKAIEVE